MDYSEALNLGRKLFCQTSLCSSQSDKILAKITCHGSDWMGNHTDIMCIIVKILLCVLQRIVFVSILESYFQLHFDGSEKCEHKYLCLPRKEIEGCLLTLLMLLTFASFF